MRAREILTEATLAKTSSSSWHTYLSNLITSKNIQLGEKGDEAQGLELTDEYKDAIQRFVSRLNPKLMLPKQELSNISSELLKLTVEFTDGTSAKIGRIYKSSELKKHPEGSERVSSSGKQDNKKYWNDGAIAETFLGAALFTRFQSTDPIQVTDVIAVIKLFEETQNGYTMHGMRDQHAIHMIALNTDSANQAVMQYVKDHEGMAQEYESGVRALDRIMKSCVSYVNESPKVLTALKEADDNDQADEILIKTDGVSDQKGTKADLKLKIGDYERLLSLKVAQKQFGQKSGATFEVINTFFHTFIPSLSLDGLDDDWPDLSDAGSKQAKKEGRIVEVYDEVFDLIGEAYKAAGDEIKSMLSDPTELFDNLYNGIIHHAQGGADNQTIIVLNPSTKKAWQELELGTPLKEALKSFKLDVSVSVKGEGEGENHILKIFGRAKDKKGEVAMANDFKSVADAKQTMKVAKRVKTDPEELLRMRSYIQDGPYIRNVIEMGPLLKDLTDVQKINGIEPEPDVSEPVQPKQKFYKKPTVSGQRMKR